MLSARELTALKNGVRDAVIAVREPDAARSAALEHEWTKAVHAVAVDAGCGCGTGSGGCLLDLEARERIARLANSDLSFENFVSMVEEVERSV